MDEKSKMYRLRGILSISFRIIGKGLVLLPLGSHLDKRSLLCGRKIAPKLLQRVRVSPQTQLALRGGRARISE